MRHVEFNPRDEYISPEKRKELQDLLQPMQRALNPTVDAMHDVVAAEMTDMISRGATHTTTVADGSQQGVQSDMLPHDSGQYNVLRRVGDTIHMANRDQMPGSAIAERLLHAKNVEVALAIAAWFHKAGTLTPDEFHQLLTRLGQPVTWNGK